MGRPKIPHNQYTKPKPEGANTRALKNALEGYRHARVDTQDPQAIAQRIDEYLQYCMDNDVSPGVAGCANWLGIGVRTLERWYTGDAATPEHQRVAARFYGVIQDVWQSDMHEGNVNPVAGIFVSKVFYGYKDTQEIVIQHKDTQELSVADLIAESKRLSEADALALPGNTIDADYSVIENDPAYEKAVKRKNRVRINPEEDTPARKKKRDYYSRNKERYKGYREKYKAQKEAKQAAENAQKDAQNGNGAGGSEPTSSGTP